MNNIKREDFDNVSMNCEFPYDTRKDESFYTFTVREEIVDTPQLFIIKEECKDTSSSNTFTDTKERRDATAQYAFINQENHTSAALYTSTVKEEYKETNDFVDLEELESQVCV